MDFDFSEEQYALRDMARDLFEKESSPARLRELWNGAERDARTWKTLAEVGILGLAIPETFGGSGGTLLDLALVLEEAGRFAVAEPLVETAAVAAPVLASSSLAEEWLPRIAAGDAVMSVAIEGAPFVLEAASADAVLVQEGPEIRLATRFQATPVRSMDLARRIYTISVEESSLVSSDPAAAARMRALGAFATAAVLNGIGMRLVEMTQAYVSARKQFGKPVGSFQSVQHKVADMHVAVESSRPPAWYAAYADSAGLGDAVMAAHAAKARASEASAFVNQEALQCHGGIGFTWEHDLHLWLKRGKALEHAFGSASEHRAALAETLFDA